MQWQDIYGPGPFESSGVFGFFLSLIVMLYTAFLVVFPFIVFYKLNMIIGLLESLKSGKDKGE